MSNQYDQLAECCRHIAGCQRQIAAMHNEIELLRLTEAEREAIAAAARIIDAYEEEMDGFASGAAATLRGLLERLR